MCAGSAAPSPQITLEVLITNPTSARSQHPEHGRRIDTARPNIVKRKLRLLTRQPNRPVATPVSRTPVRLITAESASRNATTHHDAKTEILSRDSSCRRVNAALQQAQSCQFCLGICLMMVELCSPAGSALGAKSNCAPHFWGASFFRWTVCLAEFARRPVSPARQTCGMIVILTLEVSAGGRHIHR